MGILSGSIVEAHPCEGADSRFLINSTPQARSLGLMTPSWVPWGGPLIPLLALLALTAGSGLPSSPTPEAQGFNSSTLAAITAQVRGPAFAPPGGRSETVVKSDRSVSLCSQGPFLPICLVVRSLSNGVPARETDLGSGR
jgi:hypothetical protein